MYTNWNNNIKTLFSYNNINLNDIEINELESYNNIKIHNKDEVFDNIKQRFNTISKETNPLYFTCKQINIQSKTYLIDNNKILFDYSENPIIQGRILNNGIIEWTI
jgi:hypothetical protein